MKIKNANKNTNTNPNVNETINTKDIDEEEIVDFLNETLADLGFNLKIKSIFKYHPTLKVNKCDSIIGLSTENEIIITGLQESKYTDNDVAGYTKFGVFLKEKYNQVVNIILVASPKDEEKSTVKWIIIPKEEDNAE